MGCVRTKSRQKSRENQMYLGRKRGPSSQRSLAIWIKDVSKNTIPFLSRDILHKNSKTAKKDACGQSPHGLGVEPHSLIYSHLSFSESPTNKVTELLLSKHVSTPLWPSRVRFPFSLLANAFVLLDCNPIQCFWGTTLRWVFTVSSPEEKEQQIFHKTL